MEVSQPDPVLSKEKLMSKASPQSSGPPEATASTEAVVTTSTVVKSEDSNTQTPEQESELPAGAETPNGVVVEVVQPEVATASAAASHDIRKASANVLAVAEMCLLAGKSDMTFSALERGLSVEQVRTELLAAKADATPEIRSHIMPQAGTQATAKSEVSPVVLAAQQRAQKLAANRPSYKSN
jgi:hypothetical protein